MATPGKANRVAALIALSAAAWFFLLSHWLMVTPGSLMLRRLNLFFQSDAAYSVHVLSGNPIPPAARPITTALPIVHPLVPSLWRQVTRVTDLAARTTGLEGGPERGPRLLGAVIAGVGVGGLALMAQTLGLARLELTLAFLIYLLFTSSVIVALPEHFALSNGLLSVAFCALWLWQCSRAARVTAVLSLFAAAGTTVTNVVFAALALVKMAWGRRSWVLLGILAGLSVLGSLVFAEILRSKADWFLGRFLNGRLLRDPFGALAHVVAGLIYPAVGPVPYVRAVDRSIWPLTSPEPFVLPDFAVTYEPPDLARYSPLSLLGAVAWMLLLVRAAETGWRDAATRSWVGLLAVWIGFNLLLHNVWGDELFLYSPHWSWSLMAVVLLGIRHLPRWFTIVTATLIAAGQIQTLSAIRSALDEAVNRSG